MFVRAHIAPCKNLLVMTYIKSGAIFVSCAIFKVWLYVKVSYRQASDQPCGKELLQAAMYSFFRRLTRRAKAIDEFNLATKT